MRHYGVELFSDIEAWGGSFQTSHPNTIPLIAQGKSNSLMREDTAAGPAGVAAQLFPFVLLPLDEDIADLIERDYCAPKVTIPAGTIHGQKEPCLTVTNPGFELIVNKDLPDDVVIPDGEGVGSIERRGVCSAGRVLQRAACTEVDRSAASRSRALLSRTRRAKIGIPGTLARSQFLTIAGACAGALAAGGAPVAALADNQTIRMTMASTTVFYAPYIIAIEKGYYGEEGLTPIVTIAGGGVATPAQISGSIDINTSATAANTPILPAERH